MAGQPIILTLPGNGEAFSTAATKIVTAITALEVELERKVVPADININADLSFVSGGQYRRAKDLLATSYVLSASALSASSYPRSLYFTGTDGDLYVNDGAGRQVRLIANGAVNIASASGITSTGSPAYGASGVEFRWDGVDSEFEARSGTGLNSYADIRLDDVIFNDGSNNFLRVTASSMASDYTLTLPASVPATNNTLLTMNTSGALLNTGTPTVSTLTTTSNVVVGGSLEVADFLTVAGTGNFEFASISDNLAVDGLTFLSGNVDAQASLDVAADCSVGGALTVGNAVVAGADVFISGASRYRHGDYQMVLPASAFHTGGSAIGPSLSPGNYYHWQYNSTANYYAPILLPVGARIRSIIVTIVGGGGAGTRQIVLASSATASHSVTTLADITTASTTGVITISTGAVNHTMVTTSDVTLRVLLAADDYLKSALLTYDYP